MLISKNTRAALVPPARKTGRAETRRNKGDTQRQRTTQRLSLRSGVWPILFGLTGTLSRSLRTLVSKDKRAALVPEARKASHAGTRRKKGETQEQRTTQRLLLGAGVLLILFGLAGAVFYGDSAETAAISAPESGPNPAYPAVAAAAITSDPQLSAAAIEAIPQSVDDSVRDSSLAQFIRIDGIVPSFQPVRELVLPEAGKAPTVFCLLRVRLDRATEERWQASGMLDNERLLSPFIRTVTLANQEARDNLVDWHVEGVAIGRSPESLAFCAEAWPDGQ